MGALLDRLLDKVLDRLLDRAFKRIDQLDDQLPVIVETMTRTVLDRTGLGKVDDIAKTIVKELLAQLTDVIPLSIFRPRQEER